VCIYFQVHQPFRIRRFRVFDIGQKKGYFDEEKNREILRRVAKKCYLPANKMLRDLVRESGGRFKVAFSITGTALEQFEKYVPEVLESFKELASLPQVEFLGETYYHSLSYLFSKKEFREQVKLHKKAMKRLFGSEPRVFRNTELIYTNAMAEDVKAMGFKAILAEGADSILQGRSPNHVYQSNTSPRLPLLVKNYRLSDDVAFRFSDRNWAEYPLTAEKYVSWLNTHRDDETINLFMDYETIGEHQWVSTGIFRFFRTWPIMFLKEKNNSFILPSELSKAKPAGVLDVPGVVSWADIERDCSAWLGNEMQHAAAKELYALENAVKASKDKGLLREWRLLQTSDHFYYMCTKYFADGDVHKYFNPYDSPYDAFIAFMNILNDLALRTAEALSRRGKKEEALPKPVITESPSRLPGLGG